MVAMYFLTIRPQKKRMEEEKKMRSSLKVGDNIITIGGVRGQVVEITDDSFIIETGPDHIKMEFLTSALGYIVKPVDRHQQVEEKEIEEKERTENQPEENEE